MRVIANGAYVLEASKSVTGATNANPCVVTVVAHGWANGDWVYLAGIGGTTQLNGNVYVIAGVTADTFQLKDAFGDNIDSTAYGVYTSGGTAARLYTLVTPWAEADLSYLKWTQSADVMSICCWNQITGTSYQPRDLSRLANNNWSLAVLDPTSGIAPPSPIYGAFTLAAGVGDPKTSYAYVVTSIDDTTGEESIASAQADITGGVDIAITAGTNVVSWYGAPAAASSFRIYRYPEVYNSAAAPVTPGSLLGFVGRATNSPFNDSNIVPDYAIGPPTHQNPFAPGAIDSVHITSIGTGLTAGVGWSVTTGTGSGFDGYPVVINTGGDHVLSSFVITDHGKNYAPGDTITFTAAAGTPPTADLNIGPVAGTYPSVVAYFQQRRAYAGTPNQPDTYFMSRPGAFTNFDTRIPSVPDDAIIGTPWSVQVDGIQYMVPMPGGLVVLTGSSVWLVNGASSAAFSSGPITPASQQAQPQADNGCSDTVPPIKIVEHILYVQAKDSIIRDIAFSLSSNIYAGTDITVLSSQLFTGYTVVQWAWCEEPFKIVWAVRDDGALLSLTYMKEQEVQGWARHDTQGLFQSLCSVTEPPVDALYNAVQRFIGLAGRAAYTVERMDNREWAQDEDVWAVDCGLSITMPTPAAILYASSATGLGQPTAVTSLVGGSGYSIATTATLQDPAGTGAAVSLTVDGSGAITAVGFTGGTGYTNPLIVLSDPGGSGGGFSAQVTLDNSATFTASAAVFASGDVGSVIRVGGGMATVTHYTDTTHVTGNITRPITQIVPNTPTNLPAPAASGDWTLTPPITTVSGLMHLVGSVVTGLADGEVIAPQTVSAAGTITLATPASAVVVGLGYQAQAQTLYLDTGAPTIEGRRKKIAAITARIEASKGIKVGANQPDGAAQSPPALAVPWTNMEGFPDLAPPPYGSTHHPLYTGDVRLPVTAGFTKPGQLAFQQDNPLPMQILAVIPEILEGDLPEAGFSGHYEDRARKRAA